MIEDLLRSFQSGLSNFNEAVIRFLHNLELFLVGVSGMTGGTLLTYLFATRHDMHPHVESDTLYNVTGSASCGHFEGVKLPCC